MTATKAGPLSRAKAVNAAAQKDSAPILRDGAPEVAGVECARGGGGPVGSGISSRSVSPGGVPSGARSGTVGAALVSLASALRVAAARRIHGLGRRVGDGPVVLMVEIVDEGEAKAVFKALTGRPYKSGDWGRW